MQQYCPSCGLVLAMRGPRVAYCPRCLALRHSVVELIEAPGAPVRAGAGGYSEGSPRQPGGPRPHPRAPARAPRPPRGGPAAS